MEPRRGIDRKFSRLEFSLFVVLVILLIVVLVTWQIAFAYEVQLADKGFHSKPARLAIYSFPFVAVALSILTLFNGAVFYSRGRSGLKRILPVVKLVCTVLVGFAVWFAIGELYAS